MGAWRIFTQSGYALKSGPEAVGSPLSSGWLGPFIIPLKRILTLSRAEDIN